MTSNSKKRTASEVLVNGITKLTARRTNWLATMTDLGNDIHTLVHGKLPSDWPTTPSLLRVRLNRVVRNVRRNGVSVRFLGPTGRSRARLVEFSVR